MGQVNSYILRFFILTILCLLATPWSYGNTSCDSILRNYELEALEHQLSININQPQDSNKANIEKVEQIMEEIIDFPCSFDYSFDNLKTAMSILTAPDGTFKIFNWSYIHPDGSYTYYASIIRKDDNGTIHKIKLTDTSDSIKNPEYSQLNKNNWYGCMYYDIITNKDKKKTYYTLLGWDGKDLFSNVKIIDILTFSKTGDPSFGKNIFKGTDPKQMRVLLTYSQKSSMTLQYNRQKNMIIFDHLSPVNPLYSGKYDYYGADFTFDAYEFIDGHWLYHPDIDIRNPKPLKKQKK